jgi:hypothetical protein
MKVVIVREMQRAPGSWLHEICFLKVKIRSRGTENFQGTLDGLVYTLSLIS